MFTIKQITAQQVDTAKVATRMAIDWFMEGVGR